MKKIESAFPDPHRIDIKGMSLRDYFAAKAIDHLISLDISYEELAKQAYFAADAMMKERAK